MAEVHPGSGTDRFTVHPSALCESDTVGAGTRIWAFAHVMAGATIGEDCNLCDHTFVEGGAVLGDFVTLKNGVSVWDRVTLGDHVFVGPGVVFTNDRVPRARPYRTAPEAFQETVVGFGAVLGANATIRCGVVIGRHALIGAGAVVTHDVADFAVVQGVPARRVGWICACGTRIDDTLHCGCGRRYRCDGSPDRRILVDRTRVVGQPVSALR